MALLERKPALSCIKERIYQRWKCHLDQMHPRQIERPEKNISETFPKSPDNKQIVDVQPISVTSEEVQLLSSQRKATTEASGELGKNTTERATTTSKPTPQARARAIQLESAKFRSA